MNANARHPFGIIAGEHAQIAQARPAQPRGPQGALDLVRAEVTRRRSRRAKDVVDVRPTLDRVLVGLASETTWGAATIVASVLLGAAFIYGSWRLMRHPDRRSALRLYLYSLGYLAALFAAMVADVRL